MVGREIGTVVNGIKNRIGILKEAAYWRKDDVYRCQGRVEKATPEPGKKGQ